ncbi:MAG: hypothetical protein GTO51_00425 [Candidatus Latescibacteria bacterium]|nr:hypothetical protein [Candidatus Latescibacterota bacterium]NIM64447.1 hypothetical protein [Candidatus Latescibacterota bacterium]NIO27001.1 hypothetical protein [Candidatus Latescibacterota bacterium]NIO56078.1 hypothetical protein [Candidatus Latescibacterota bacterium]NIT00598.1 hypothetical protein [Candidatus Latescibacterota bacterium]
MDLPLHNSAFGFRKRKAQHCSGAERFQNVPVRPGDGYLETLLYMPEIGFERFGGALLSYFKLAEWANRIVAYRLHYISCRLDDVSFQNGGSTSPSALGQGKQRAIKGFSH